MKRPEMLGRLLVIAGVLIVLSVPLAVRFSSARGVIEIHARIAESGGWSPNSIKAQVGVPLHLRLTSDDVMHSFAIGQSEMPAVDVPPGKMTELTLTFDKPGTYTYYCTRWCGPNHWRMRGTIEVTGDGSDAPQPVSPPLYMTLNLDIDAPHPAPVMPVEKPSALRGAAFTALLPASYLAADYYRSHSPAQFYLDLRADPALSSLGDLDVWNLIAYIWQTNTTPEGLAEGQRLYAQNCAACHGETGGGNGVFSTLVEAQTGKLPANFSAPVSMLGASPALLQGKILRGGMGTGMPYWGPIFKNETIWGIIGYLYTFQFDESHR
jgi:mono/diheme cytochrome c family protein/plastocyanin